MRLLMRLQTDYSRQCSSDMHTVWRSKVAARPLEPSASYPPIESYVVHGNSFCCSCGETISFASPSSFYSQSFVQTLKVGAELPYQARLHRSVAGIKQYMFLSPLWGNIFSSCEFHPKRIP